MKKKQKWKVGDVFLVPLCDGNYSVGQVLSWEKDALNSVVCVFSILKVKNKNVEIALDPDKIISALFTTPDLLDSGDWIVVDNSASLSVDDFFDMKSLKSDGFIGIKVIGSGIVIKFMDACFGLYPWDGFYESDYLDKLLLSPDKKPNKIIYK